MTDPTAAPTRNSPLPKRSSRWAKRLLGCLGVCVLLCCGVVSLVGYGLHEGFGFVRDKVERDLEQQTRADLDRLFEEVLTDGDAEKMYDAAHPRVRDSYGRDEFVRFVEA